MQSGRVHHGHDDPDDNDDHLCEHDDHRDRAHPHGDGFHDVDVDGDGSDHVHDLHVGDGYFHRSHDGHLQHRDGARTNDHRDHLQKEEQRDVLFHPRDFPGYSLRDPVYHQAQHLMTYYRVTY